MRHLYIEMVQTKCVRAHVHKKMVTQMVKERIARIGLYNPESHLGIPYSHARSGFEPGTLISQQAVKPPSFAPPKCAEIFIPQCNKHDDEATEKNNFFILSCGLWVAETSKNKSYHLGEVLCCLACMVFITIIRKIQSLFRMFTKEYHTLFRNRIRIRIRQGLTSTDPDPSLFS